MKTIIIGGGAAGFFLAINLKEMVPGMDVTIIERSQHLLNKVSLSGGGRCNCTNTFQSVEDLKNVYPRGHRLMKRGWVSTYGAAKRLPASTPSATTTTCASPQAGSLTSTVC